MRSLIRCSILLLACAGCGDSQHHSELSIDPNLFEAGISQGVILRDEIDEASGLVASRQNPNALWTHNDSGGKSRLFLVGSKGEDLGVLKLEGIKARDWEDVALGSGPEAGVSYLYVGDIGDNKARHATKRIYRFVEPVLEGKTSVTISADEIDTLEFQYPDGKRDAETLMIDPLSKDIYVVSKREDRVHLYLAPYPQSTTEVISLQMVGTLPLTYIVAGDISPDGQEVLLKDYNQVFYWRRKGSESIAELLLSAPTRLPYEAEPQGESIAWARDKAGYYTLSEERDEAVAELMFYRRKATPEGEE